MEPALILDSTLAVLVALLGGAGWLYREGFRAGDRPGDVRWRCEPTFVLGERPLSLQSVALLSISNPGGQPAYAVIDWRRLRGGLKRIGAADGPRGSRCTVLEPRSVARVFVPLEQDIRLGLLLTLPDGRRRARSIGLRRGDPGARLDRTAQADRSSS